MYVNGIENSIRKGVEDKDVVPLQWKEMQNMIFGSDDFSGKIDDFKLFKGAFND